MHFNGHTPTEEPQPNNPESSDATPTQAPVQLAFGFDLAPQPEGHKIPWSKRIRVDGLSDYLNILDDLIANPPGWETQFWLDHPARKREWVKKAHYIAWACSPAYSRQPRTQKEVAAMLGVTPVAICLWKSKNPEMIKLIQERTLEPLEQALADVYRVTIDQAIDPNGSVQARKLYFEALSDARNARLPMNPAQMVQLVQTFVSNINWNNLTSEQMDRIAAGEHPLLVLAANVGGEVQAGEVR